MTTASTWTHDTGANAYTLIQGEYRCHVWRTRFDTWAAAVNYRGTSSASYNFETAEEAKAWCEQQVTKADRRM
jgi:hypothetical protein